jgi:hypothetical protein
VLVVLAGGCGGASHAPGWPSSAGTVASTDWTQDGGEPISPRSQVGAAAMERSTEPESEAKAKAKADEPAAIAVSAPDAPATPEASAPEELQLEEEIIIEITD